MTKAGSSSDNPAPEPLLRIIASDSVEKMMKLIDEASESRRAEYFPDQYASGSERPLAKTRSLRRGTDYNLNPSRFWPGRLFPVFRIFYTLIGQGDRLRRVYTFT